MSTSVWPYDTLIEPSKGISNRSLGEITCFVASPFEPKERWNDLFALISNVTAQVAKSFGVGIKCVRADQIASAGIIHPEIWMNIRESDFLIFDITGHNANVMLELGVAAACRRKEHVIILRDANDSAPRPFDINPARHLDYQISFTNMQDFQFKLAQTVSNVLASLPFDPPHSVTVQLPFKATLSGDHDARELYTVDFCHRKLLSDCLEFGSPLSYQHSWMSLGDLRMSTIHVKARMKMTYQNTTQNTFMGIMLRATHYFANCGHLIYVDKNGNVVWTVVEDDLYHYRDEGLGNIPNFDPMGFTDFDISMDDQIFDITVGPFKIKRQIQDLPHVFSAGRLLFIGGYCRVGIRDIEVAAI